MSKIERPTWGAAAIAELFNVKESTVVGWIRNDAPQKQVLRQTIDGGRWYAFESEVAEFLRRPRSQK